jgi:hypothetical protein
MVKKKILIASVLKPANEPRMYKKPGLSLAEKPNLEVHIAGYEPTGNISDKLVEFHPIFNFNRLSIKRLSLKKPFINLLERIRPDVLIVNTFELLPTAVQYKRHANCTLIYDVRENHRYNILHLGVYPFPVKNVLARIVSGIESRYAPETDHFLLAESCYANELDFIAERFTVIENKYQGELIQRTEQKGKIRMSFTGTIHFSTGIEEAIRFFEMAKDAYKGLTLTITGHAAQDSVMNFLESKKQPGIILNVQDRPLSNDEILKTYSQTDILLAPYRMSTQNRNKVPTKLYDALANGIPMIISKNEKWQNLTQHLPWIYHHDFNDKNIDDLLTFIREKHFTQAQRDATWETEIEKLLSLSYF